MIEGSPGVDVFELRALGVKVLSCALATSAATTRGCKGGTMGIERAASTLPCAAWTTCGDINCWDKAPQVVRYNS